MNVFCPTDVIFAEKAIEPSHDKANKYIMYSDKKNILQLVALLIEHNIKKIVVSRQPQFTYCTYDCQSPFLLLLSGDRRTECGILRDRAGITWR